VPSFTSWQTGLDDDQLNQIIAPDLRYLQAGTSLAQTIGKSGQKEAFVRRHIHQHWTLT
jgi:hypothetical protein